MTDDLTAFGFKRADVPSEEVDLTAFGFKRADIPSAEGNVPAQPASAPVATPAPVVDDLTRFGFKVADEVHSGLPERPKSVIDLAVEKAKLIDASTGFNADRAKSARATIKRDRAYAISPLGGVRSFAAPPAPRLDEYRTVAIQEEAEEAKKPILREVQEQIWEEAKAKKEAIRSEYSGAQNITGALGKLNMFVPMTVERVRMEQRTPELDPKVIKERNQRLFIADLNALADESELYYRMGVRSDVQRKVNELIKGEEYRELIPFSPEGLVKSIELSTLIKKVQAGEELTPLEDAKVQRFATDATLMAELGETAGSQVLMGTLGSLKMAAEFAATAGVANAATSGTGMIRAYLASKAPALAGTKIASGLGKVLDLTGAALARTAVNPIPIAEKTVEDMADYAFATYGEDGRDIAISENDKELFGTLANAAGSAFITNFAESAGDDLIAGLKALTPGVRQKVINTAFLRSIKRSSAGKGLDAFLAGAKRAGVSSLPAESLEERLEAGLRELFGIDKDQRGDTTMMQRLFWKDFEGFLVESAVLGLVSGPVTTATVARRESAIRTLTKAGFSRSEAQSLIDTIQEKDTTEAKQELLSNAVGEKLGLVTKPDVKARIEELAEKPVLSIDEQIEYNGLIEQASPLDTQEAEKARLEKDIDYASKSLAQTETNVDTWDPQNLTQETPLTNNNLRQMAKAVLRTRGKMEPTSPEILEMARSIKELYVEPMQRVEVVKESDTVINEESGVEEAPASEIGELYKQWKRGLRSQAMIDALSEIDEGLVEELYARTLGEGAEGVSEVMSDLVRRAKKMQSGAVPSADTTTRERVPMSEEQKAMAQARFVALNERRLEEERIKEEEKEQAKAEREDQRARERRQATDTPTTPEQAVDVVQSKEHKIIEVEAETTRIDEDIAPEKEEQLAEAVAQEIQATELAGERPNELVEEGYEVVHEKTIYVKRDGSWYNKRTGRELKNDLILVGIDNKIRKGNLQTQQNVGEIEAGLERTAAQKAEKPVEPEENMVYAKEKALLKRLLQAEQKASKSGKKAGRIEAIKEIKKELSEQYRSAEERQRAIDNLLGYIESIEVDASRKYISDKIANIRVMAQKLSTKSQTAQETAFNSILDNIIRLQEYVEKQVARQKKQADETVVIKAKALLAGFFKAQEKGSRAGYKQGAKETAKQLRDLKMSAIERQKVLDELINEIDISTLPQSRRAWGQRKKASLRLNAAKLLRYGEKGQEAAFDRVLDSISDTVAQIDEHTPKYEYVPFPPAETVSGVDANSNIWDIKKAYFLASGKRGENKKQMLHYLNGTNTELATAEVQGDIDAIRERKARWSLGKHGKRQKALDSWISRSSQLLNLFDMLDVLSRGNGVSALRNIKKGIIDSNKKEADISVRYRKMLSDLDKKGAIGGKLGKMRVRVVANGEVKTIALFELMGIDIALGNEKHAKSLSDETKDRSGVGYIFSTEGILSAKKSVHLTEAEWKKMLNDALASLDEQTRQQYDHWKNEVYLKMVQSFGEEAAPVVNGVMQSNGKEGTFVIEDSYIPMQWLTQTIPVDKEADSETELSLEEETEIAGSDGMKVSNNVYNEAIYSSRDPSSKVSNKELYTSRHKTRTGGKGTGFITVGRADVALLQLMGDTARTVAKAEINNRLIKALNNKQLAMAIVDVFGLNTLNTIRSKVAQSTGNMTMTKIGLVDKTASLGFAFSDIQNLSRLSTAFVMGSSSHLIRPYLHNQSSYAIGMQHITSPFLIKKLREDSVARNRFDSGNMIPEFMESGQSIRAASGGFSFKKFSQSLVSVGDKAGVMGVFSTLAFDHLSEKGLPRTMKELKKQDAKFWDEVSYKLNEMILKTQPSGESAAVSELKGRSRNNYLIRAFTRYGSQQSRLYNNVLTAYGDWVSDPTPETAKHLAQVVEAMIITNSVLMATIKTSRRVLQAKTVQLIAKMIGGDDEKYAEKIKEEIEAAPERWVSTAVKNSLSMIEGVDNVVGLIDYIGSDWGRGEAPGREWGGVVEDTRKLVMATKRVKKYEEQLEKGFAEDESGRRRKINYSRVKEQLANAISDQAEAALSVSAFAARIPAETWIGLSEPILDKAASERTR